MFTYKEDLLSDEHTPSSPYDRALCLLIEMSESLLPLGWQKPFDEMVQCLRAARHPCRAHVDFGSFRIEDGALVLSMSDHDPVVEGILRRGKAWTAHTCHQCGLPAQLRQIGLSIAPLCPQCYGARALRRDLKKLLRDLESDNFLQQGVHLEVDLPPRAKLALSADLWRTLVDPTTKATVRCITVETLRQEMPRLKSLVKMLGNFTCLKGYDPTTFDGGDHG